MGITDFRAKVILLAPVLWIFLLYLNLSQCIENGDLNSENCIRSAVCTLIRRDMQKLVDNSVDNLYNQALKDVAKYNKLKSCPIQKGISNCNKKLSDCETLISYEAIDHFYDPQSGLPRPYPLTRPSKEVLKECWYKTWSYVIFGCKNIEGWPNEIPAEYKECRLSCHLMELAEKYQPNGPGLPDGWDSIKKFIERDEKSFLYEENKLTPEKREIASQKQIVTTYHFANNNFDGVLMRERICPYGYFFDRIDHQKSNAWPKESQFICRRPEDSADTTDTYVLYGGQVISSSNDVQNCAEEVNEPSYEKYQIDDLDFTPLLSGIELSANKEGYLSAVNYLCTNSLFDFKYFESVAGEFSVKCGESQAVCSIQFIVNPPSDSYDPTDPAGSFNVVNLKIGCCPIPTKLSVTAYVPSIEDQISVPSNQQVSNSDMDSESWKMIQCPEDEVIASFHSYLMIPIEGPSKANLRSRPGSGKPLAIFATNFGCRPFLPSYNHNGGWHETRPLDLFGSNYKIIKNLGKKVCKRGSYTGGGFRVIPGRLFLKQFDCTSGAEDGRVEIKSIELKSKDLSSEGYFVEYIKYEGSFHCPRGKALCGVAYRKPEGRSLLEGYAFKFLCCSVFSQPCNSKSVEFAWLNGQGDHDLRLCYGAGCLISTKVSTGGKAKPFRDWAEEEQKVTDRFGFTRYDVFDEIYRIAMSSKETRKYGADSGLITWKLPFRKDRELKFPPKNDDGKGIYAFPSFLCENWMIQAEFFVAFYVPLPDCHEYETLAVIEPVDVDPQILNTQSEDRTLTLSFKGYGTKWLTDTRTGMNRLFPLTKIIKIINSTKYYREYNPWENKFNTRTDRQISEEYDEDFVFTKTIFIPANEKPVFVRRVAFCNPDFRIFSDDITFTKDPRPGHVDRFDTFYDIVKD